MPMEMILLQMEGDRIKHQTPLIQIFFHYKDSIMFSFFDHRWLLIGPIITVSLPACLPVSGFRLNKIYPQSEEVGSINIQANQVSLYLSKKSRLD